MGRALSRPPRGTRPRPQTPGRGGRGRSVQIRSSRGRQGPPSHLSSTAQQTYPMHLLGVPIASHHSLSHILQFVLLVMRRLAQHKRRSHKAENLRPRTSSRSAETWDAKHSLPGEQHPHPSQLVETSSLLLVENRPYPKSCEFSRHPRREPRTSAVFVRRAAAPDVWTREAAELTERVPG
jgi:hypothetical protein